MSTTEQKIGFEECARRILQRELGRPVLVNDDGRQPGLYDLRVGDVDAPDIAIECIGAVDALRTETWNIGPAQGPLILNLNHDWHVVLKPHARVTAIRSNLQDVLRLCEVAAITGHTPVDWSLKHHQPHIFAVLDALQIDSIACFREAGAGRVYLGMTGTGGAVDPYGTAVPGWIEAFLTAPRQSDVIRKLERSSAALRHVFVGVSFAGVPWEVESYLGTQTDHVPPTLPRLPRPLDAVWMMYGRRGLQCDGVKWRFFDAVVPRASSLSRNRHLDGLDVPGHDGKT
jgi:hypothetical protein